MIRFSTYVFDTAWAWLYGALGVAFNLFFYSALVERFADETAVLS